MTTISILGGDFEILFADEVVGVATTGMKMIRRQTSPATSTVYTTNALYSAIAESTDEFVAMGFQNPMLPVTPNAYTMENDYFIPRSSTEFLKEGAIDATWTATATTGIVRKEYAVVTNFVTGDIGRLITESASSDTGTLLDFEQEPDGQWVAWIRPDDPATDLFDSTTGTIGVQAGGEGGTGVGNTVAVAANSGRTLFSSIQAIGSVPTASEVYVYQDRVKLGTSLDPAAFQFWSTDPSVSLGIIDILVRVIDAGVTIADGDVEVFARRYTSLYDNFRLNVVAGGRSALPLASAADINNTTGYNASTLTGSGGGTWLVGNHWYIGASYTAATAKGVITAVTDGGTATPDIEYYLVHDLTDISNTTVTEYDPSASADTGVSATGAGASTNTSGGPTDTPSSSMTISLGGFLVDHDGDGTSEPYSMQVDCNAQSTGLVYERMKYITRRGATADMITGMNVPGESYRGLDGIIEYGTASGTLTEGDDMITNSSGATWTARVLHQNTTNSPTYITVTDQQTSVDSVVDTYQLEDEAANDVDVTTTTIGIATITSPKSSPFGTYTGSQIFGARGVHFTNKHANDGQAYTLTDDIGTLRESPNTVSFTVSQTAAGDRILVARDTGTAGVIDKDQFGGLSGQSGVLNGQGDSVVQVDGTIDGEVPDVAWVRIVETTKLEEHRYVYSSRTAVANGQFTLKAVPDGTVTTTSGTQLIDTGANFTLADVVEIGMLVRNTSSGGGDEVWEITAITDPNTLEISFLYGDEVPPVFSTGDGYQINKLIQDYTVDDNIFDLILDLEALTGTGLSTDNEFTQFVQSTTFNVVVNVRQGKVIIPFSTNGSVGATGGSVAVVRATDTIAS